MADVVWSEQAMETLDAAIDYVERHDVRAARGIRQRLIAAASSLSSFPNRRRPAMRGFRELATVPPYVIRYSVDDDGTVTIARIRHGRRRRSV